MCCVCVYAGNSVVNTNWKLCWYYSFQELIVETHECV